MQIILPPAIKQKSLDAYLKITESFFPHTEKVSGEERVEYVHVSSEYFVACNEKESSTETWEQLIASWRNKKTAGYIRDMSAGEMHLLKAIVTPAGDTTQAVVVHINFLGNLIGYYYAAKQPVQPKSSVFTKQGNLIPKVSYLPFNDFQVLFKEKLLNDIITVFPSFTEFDNEYADFKIASIQTYGMYLKNTDLFQVLFTTNIHGIL